MRTEQNLILSSCRSVLTSKSDITPPTSPDTPQSRLGASSSSFSVHSLDDDPPRSLLMGGFPDCGDFGDSTVFSDVEECDHQETDEDDDELDRLIALCLDDSNTVIETEKAVASIDFDRGMLQRCDVSFNRSRMIKIISERSLNVVTDPTEEKFNDPDDSGSSLSQQEQELQKELLAMSHAELASRFIAMQQILTRQQKPMRVGKTARKSKKSSTRRVMTA